MSKQLAKREPDAEKVHQVFQWILQGATEHDVRDAIAKQWPKEQSEPLIMVAALRFSKSGEFDGTTVRGWCFEAYRDLYRRMVEVGDFAGAIRAVKLINDMAGR